MFGRLDVVFINGLEHTHLVTNIDPSEQYVPGRPKYRHKYLNSNEPQANENL